jgi:hypothetical protein
MRLVIALAFASLASAQTPGTPVSSTVGSLSCGVRAYSATQVQTWCFAGKAPALTLVHNTITTLQFGGALVISFSYPELSGAVSSINWFVRSTLAYQIVVGQCSPACMQSPTTSGTLPAAAQ